MKFTKDLSLGFSSYILAVGFTIRNGFLKYLIIPLVLFGIIFYTGHKFEEISNNAEAAIAAGEYSWGFVGKIGLWIKQGFFFLLKFLFIDATKYLVIMFLSPLLAILSEKTEEILTGNKYKFDLKQLIKDVKRGIGIAIRMLIAEFAIILIIWRPLCWLLGWDNLLVYEDNGTEKSIIVQTGIVIIGAYFYGFAFIDYINERLRLTIKESWKFMRKHAGLAIAIGLVYSLFYRIPSMIPTSNKWLETILDNFGVLFAPVLAIVAATLAMHKLVDLNNSKFAKKNTPKVPQTEINSK